MQNNSIFLKLSTAESFLGSVWTFLRIEYLFKKLNTLGTAQVGAALKNQNVHGTPFVEKSGFSV